MDENQKLSVRISVPEGEDFWRADVRHPGTAPNAMSATFLMPPIHGAVSADQTAWQHLARCGHANLTRPTRGFRGGGK